MLDRNNVSAYTDDHGASRQHGRVRYGVVNILAAIMAIGTLALMVSGPGACARPGRYLIGWLILMTSTLVALAPLIDLLPADLFDDEPQDGRRPCRH